MATTEEKYRWLFEILAMKELSLTERGVLIVTRLEIDSIRHEPDRGNCTTVWIPRIAERIGLSTQVVGTALKSLSEKRILEREIYYPLVDGQRQMTKRVAIGLPAELLRQPRKMLASIDLPTRNHGGKRVAFICKSCNEIGFNMKSGYRCICEHCGEVHFYTSDSAYLLTEDQLEG